MKRYGLLILLGVAVLFSDVGSAQEATEFMGDAQSSTAMKKKDGWQLEHPLDPVPRRSQFLVGPVGGLHRNYHTGGFRTISDPNCPLFEDGTGMGYLAGLTAEIVPDLFADWSIVARVYYESRPAGFSQQLPDVLVITGENTPPVEQTVSTTSDITCDMMTGDLMYKHLLMKVGDVQVGAVAGISGSYILSGTNYQVQDLDEPQNARFVNPTGLPTANFGRRLIYYDGDIPGQTTWRGALKVGMTAEMGLFGNEWVLYPGLYIDYGLTQVTDSENWNLNSVVGMIELRRAF